MPNRQLADQAILRSRKNEEAKPILLNGFVRSDLSVADVDDAVRVLRNVVFVRDENDGVALAVQVLEQRHDLLARFRIQVSGWLVGKNDGW